MSKRLLWVLNHTSRYAETLKVLLWLFYYDYGVSEQVHELLHCNACLNTSQRVQSHTSLSKSDSNEELYRLAIFINTVNSR